MNILPGTVSGPLAQAFSPKPVILCGSIMIVIGLLASVFAPNLAWLTFTYGLVFGSGLGTVYQINVIFLQQYFIKMRGLALGMNYAGSTTAGFVFPIFIAFLLGEYGFQGTLLIVSGVLMHIFVLCLTHKEAPWLQKKTDGGENSEVIKSKTPGTSHSEAVPCRNGVVSSGASEETPEPNEVLRATVDLHGQEMTKESEDQSSVPAEEPQTVGSELKEPRDVESTAVKSEFLKHETSVSVELPTVPAEKEASTGKVSLVASLSILKIPEFHVIIFSFSLYFYAYDAYFTTIVDFIVDQNISLAKATTIVPLYSITDMVARLVIPQLGDRGYINKMLLQCFAYALQSACFFLMPTAAATGNFFWIAALAMVQSTGVGTAIVMYGVLMGELIGVQRLPMAYGIVGLFVGLTYVTKPFFVGESEIILSSLCRFAVYKWERCRILRPSPTKRNALFYHLPGYL